MYNMDEIKLKCISECKTDFSDLVVIEIANEKKSK